MSSYKLAFKAAARSCAAATILLLMSLGVPALAQQVTMETLLDRIQIEDLLTRYYYDLSQGESHALSEYFTEDALLDVDGTIARGHEEIGALYQRPEADADSPPATPRPRNHMLLTNPVIEVKGDTAIAHVIWTGVTNEGVGQVPKLYEQGREDTELVKRDGTWLISRRYISSDSGLPDRFDATYEPRGNPLAEDAPKLELLAELPNAPGNLTVAPDGTVIISVHPSYPSEVIAYAVDADGRVRPFPSAAASAGMNRVLSVRADENGDVWMLAGMPGSTTKTFYIVDLATGELERRIDVESPDSFYNDMALALDKGVVVISDPGGQGSLAVLDVQSGTARRVLSGHASVAPEDIDALIDGVPLAQARDAEGELIPLRSGVNPITIDRAHEWVYYGAMSGATLWRVRLSDLMDESLSDAELGRRVERYGAKAPSAGITMDDAGNVYVADVGARGIGVTTPDGTYRVLVQDDGLIDWPDGLSVDGDGYVYSAANGLYRTWTSHAHLGQAEPPFRLTRFKALAPTSEGR